MAHETVQLVRTGAHSRGLVPHVVDFDNNQRQYDGIRYRFGRVSGDGPVAYKVAVDRAAAGPRLRRERDVSRYLGRHGGEVISRCVAYRLDDTADAALVTYRGHPLATLAAASEGWPLGHAVRTKVIEDLLCGLDLLQTAGIVHGGISMDSVRWDGSSLQILDFGRAGVGGTYLDGTVADHRDDVADAGRVIYQVHTGGPPPEDPVELRRQVERVQGDFLRYLLLRRDLVTGVDRDYAFAEESDRRPDARTLLERFRDRPDGVRRTSARAETLRTEEERSRADFHALRERQAAFRRTYRPPRAQPAGRVTSTPTPTPTPTPTSPPPRRPSAAQPGPTPTPTPTASIPGPAYVPGRPTPRPGPFPPGRAPVGGRPRKLTPEIVTGAIVVLIVVVVLLVILL